MMKGAFNTEKSREKQRKTDAVMASAKKLQKTMQQLSDKSGCTIYFMVDNEPRVTIAAPYKELPARLKKIGYHLMLGTQTTYHNAKAGLYIARRSRSSWAICNSMGTECGNSTSLMGIVEILEAEAQHANKES